MDTTTINKPIIMQSNVDTNNNPFIAIVPQVDRVTKCLTIVTNQVVNEDGGVEILSPSNLIQVYDEADLINNDNRYMVLADRAQIKFSENLEGQYVFFRHYGDGVIYMSANRVFTKLDSNGNVIETLDEIVEAVRTGIELFKTAGDLRKLSTDMDISLDNAQIIITDLNNSVVIANQTNNTLKTTTNNAKTEDTTLNTTIDLAKATDTTLKATNTTANNTNATLGTTIATGNQLNTDLTALNTTALATKSSLDTSKTNADASKSALDTSKSNADASKTALDTSNGTATQTKTDLNTLNNTATQTKTDLNTINNTATQTKTDLTTINNTATQTKTDLTTINNTATQTKTDLNTLNNTAVQTKNDLQATIDSSNIAGMKTDITNKQDKTDNTLTTTDKTIVGSLKELNLNKANEASFTGMVAYFAMTTPPTGWIKANGAIVNRTSFSRLFNVIGTTFGVGDGSTTFKIPDLRDEFIQGWDDGRGIDSARTFGSYQGDQAQKSGFENTGWGLSAGGAFIDRVLINTNYGDYAHPRNVALLACIKY